MQQTSWKNSIIEKTKRFSGGNSQRSELWSDSQVNTIGQWVVHIFIQEYMFSSWLFCRKFVLHTWRPIVFSQPCMNWAMHEFEQVYRWLGTSSLLQV